MPKAYSYLRFSTPEQMQGDSYRRQTEASLNYANDNGLELDNTLTFQDLGISGYKGKNVTEGALGKFLEAIEDERIAPGSWLLVESLDRLSRQTAQKAMMQFLNIVEQGITIVTLQDNRVFHGGKPLEFTDLMYSLMEMQRAHNESAVKSQRVGAAWANKRERAWKEGHKFTSRCPAWLKLNETRDGFEVYEDRVEVIKDIFEMTLEGMGRNRIVRLLNQRDKDTFSDRTTRWQESSISKILHNRSLLGEYQPHRMDQYNKRIPVGEPIPDYFPQVIPDRLFYRVQKTIKERIIPKGNASKKLSNVFTNGLGVCGNCGSSMHYINKGQNRCEGKYLRCSLAMRKDSDCSFGKSWRYPMAEQAVMWTLMQRGFRQIYPELYKDCQDRIGTHREELEVAQAKLCEIKERIGNLADAISRKPSETLENLLGNLEAEKVSLVKKVEEAEVAYEDATAKADTLEGEFESIYHAAHEAMQEGTIESRLRLHKLLQETLDRVEFHLKPEDDESEIHGTIVLVLKGGAERKVVISAKQDMYFELLPEELGEFDKD